jgi:hypothetical protein
MVESRVAKEYPKLIGSDEALPAGGQDVGVCFSHKHGYPPLTPPL